MEKIYIFTCEQVYGGLVFDLIVKAFKNKEDALNYFKDFVDAEFRNKKDDSVVKNWITNVDEIDFFNVSIPQTYVTNHVECVVHEVELI